jgi:hypothetical protein
LVGIATSATLALLAAGDRNLAEKVSVVAGVAPYTDVKTVLSTATTGHYGDTRGRLFPTGSSPFSPAPSRSPW